MNSGGRDFFLFCSFFPSDQHQHGLSMFRKFFALEISVGFGQVHQADLSSGLLILELLTLERGLWGIFVEVIAEVLLCGIQGSATVAAGSAHEFCGIVLAVIQPV